MLHRRGMVRPLPHGVISHPYDPLLALALVEEVEADEAREAAVADVDDRWAAAAAAF